MYGCTHARVYTCMNIYPTHSVTLLLLKRSNKKKNNNHKNNSEVYNVKQLIQQVLTIPILIMNHIHT